MRLNKLYAVQAKVDQVVQKRLDINIHSVENVDKRIHAFKVELAELSNETGWFKYWKKSHNQDRASTIEEFADCMAFILSVGISRNYHTFVSELNVEQWHKVPLEHLFDYLFSNSLASSGRWKSAFEHLMMLGLKLGFTLPEMESAYYAKSEVNIERQAKGY